MKNLVLTGWSYPEYGSAAAVALHALRGNADIFGCSMARLASTLVDRGLEYDNIYVMGIGLTVSLDKLVSALRILRERGKKTVFFTRIALPDEARALLHKEFGDSCGFTEIVQTVDAENLAKVVARYFAVEDDPAIRPLTAAAKPVDSNGKDNSRAIWMFQRLFEAAGYFHRECGDDGFYGKVVSQLWTSPREIDLVNQSDLMKGLEFYNRYGDDEIVGTSKAIKGVLAKIDKVAPHDRANVLILGESGTGKELVAKQLHRKSGRKQNPLVVDNCACMDGATVNSILFGHEKGAFTGADGVHKGLFEQADGSTLFLDEIGELPLDTQAKLLRAIDRGEIIRLGGDVKNPIRVNVRLVAATNRNLPQMVKEGRFREDLLQRLSMVIIKMPTLRERPEDIKLIAEYRWRKIADDGKSKLTAEQLDALVKYPFPGNVRELNNILERAHTLEESDFELLIKEQHDLMSALIKGGETGVEDPVKDINTHEDVLYWHAGKILERAGGSITTGAQIWGTSINTFKKYAKGKS